MIREFDLASLMRDLDGGRIGEAFMVDIKRAVADLEDRPADDTPRQVSLVANLYPIIDDRGTLDSAEVQFHIVSKLPKRRSRPISMEVRRKGGQGVLAFNDMSQDDINQRTIDEEYEDEDGV